MEHQELFVDFEKFNSLFEKSGLKNFNAYLAEKELDSKIHSILNNMKEYTSELDLVMRTKLTSDIEQIVTHYNSILTVKGLELTMYLCENMELSSKLEETQVSKT